MGETYTVQEGECLISIAEAKGFYRWQTIYYHEENAKLRKDRPDHNQIQKDDKVYIPDKEDREVLCETGKRHVFQLRDEPETLIRMLLEQTRGEPLANKEYELTITGKDEPIVGFTNDKGELLQMVPTDAKEATLKVWLSEDKSEDPLTYSLKIGDMDPINTDSGLQDRLRNLGYDLGEEDGKIGELTKAAIKAFQQNMGLNPTGDPDDPDDTRSLLKEAAETRFDPEDQRGTSSDEHK